jgi:hypothetical protein
VTVLRAVLVPLVLVLGTAAWLVGERLVAVNTPAPVATPAGHRAQVDEAWRTSYSTQFPGCVATVLWPAGERPRAILVRLASGRITRVTAGAPLLDPDLPVRGGDGGPHRVVAVGVCR